jgi:hypothetical protein
VTPDELERLADLVADRVLARLQAPAPAPSLLTAEQVAQRLGVGRDAVYAMADQLGAKRLGEGPRARLRFDAARVDEALTADAKEPVPMRRKRRQTTTNGAPLLNVRRRA